MKRTSKRTTRSNVLKFPTRALRNANIPPFGRVGVELDPHSPPWGNRQVSILNTAMCLLESLNLNARELEFLQNMVIPTMILDCSPDFKREVAHLRTLRRKTTHRKVTPTTKMVPTVVKKKAA